MSENLFMFISLIGFISIFSFIWGMATKKGANPITPFVAFFSLLLSVTAFILIIMSFIGSIQGEYKDASNDFKAYGVYCMGVALIQFIALFFEDLARVIKVKLTKN